IRPERLVVEGVQPGRRARRGRSATAFVSGGVRGSLAPRGGDAVQVPTITRPLYTVGGGDYTIDGMEDLIQLERKGDDLPSSLAQRREAFEGEIRRLSEACEFAAVIVEPVAGSTGVLIPPVGYLERLRALCDQHGILLIADEVQSGFARTGRMLACDWIREANGATPDLITVAKAMAGGFPIAGVIGRAEVMDAPDPGGLGGTYGGSPLGCVAGLEVLKIIREDQLCERAVTIGNAIKSRMRSLQAAGLSFIGDVRGPGAMVAIEIVKDGDANRPDPERTRAIVLAAAEAGLIMLSCGLRGNVVRFLPALTASDALIAEAMDTLEGVLKAAGR
ncbi:MAG: aminotransferase class III-fold pyridoxal phosphate-dependent enzyme, partial [Steroidobacteraceae bacterium]